MSACTQEWLHTINESPTSESATNNAEKRTSIFTGMDSAIAAQINEPGSDYTSGNANHRSGREKYKQVARIIKYLRDELHTAEPNLAKPTNSMIDHLVFNCPAPVFDTGDWHTVIQHVLEYLRQASDNRNQRPHNFTRQDGSTPLFPSNDLFDEQDVYYFCQAMLKHFSQE